MNTEKEGFFVGKAKKMVTTALFVAGTAAYATVEAAAQEPDIAPFTKEDVEEMEQVIMEQALRTFTNPLHRIKAELENNLNDPYKYTVQEGDTLSHIAVQHGVKVSELAQANGIRNHHRISIGQELVIPHNEITYMVKFGDTLENVAEQNGLTKEQVIAYNSSLNQSGGVLYPGLELKLPVANPEPIHQPLSPRITVQQKSATVSVASHTDTSSQPDTSFIWPVGKGAIITSSFGMRWGRPHNGIDIGHSAQGNTPIMAAAAGTVIDAYYNRGGYGNLIIIDHGNGVQTYYAHLGQIDVVEGQTVSQGEHLGMMGRTGHATGYHLHFEVHINNRPVNPVRHLPN